ncbi:hypothetical protein ASPCAL08436 [Aspergillus calidoustus]|uniref:Uncharacterized protein n=1 Tax=Aspergillus calidoustus TaxID=454130 RepID=A0A0U5GUE0_ASPCI|nr:hypothetical protein ASPCAL08436 [Aspergillus calidoustus]
MLIPFRRSEWKSWEFSLFCHCVHCPGLSAGIALVTVRVGYYSVLSVFCGLSFFSCPFVSLQTLPPPPVLHSLGLWYLLSAPQTAGSPFILYSQLVLLSFLFFIHLVLLVTFLRTGDFSFLLAILRMIVTYHLSS